MKAMILCAGLGTRLKPFTDKHPKALAIVNGKTILQRNIEYMAQYGFTDIIINVHHFAAQLIHFVTEYKFPHINIQISDEQNEVLETGGGLKKAAWFFEHSNEPFLLINVDILTNINLTDLLHYHKKNNPLATLAVSNRDSSRCFLFSNDNQLCGWRNKKTNEEKICIQQSNYVEKAFSGIQIIDPLLLQKIPFNGKFSMVDVYLELCKSNTIKAYNHTGSILMDVGTTERIKEAELYFM